MDVGEYEVAAVNLLQRRLTCSAPKRNLQSANANIGAARAAFFQITLTRTTGVASPTLSNLFDSGTSAWTFIPKISLPIFDGGVNLANLTVSKSIATSPWQLPGRFQTAFVKSPDALADAGTLAEQLAARSKPGRRGSNLSHLRRALSARADSYLNALISLRTLYTAQQNLITLRLTHSTNLVTLYKVTRWRLAAGKALRPMNEARRQPMAGQRCPAGHQVREA